MTDDQITALAREYAEFTDMSPVDKRNISAICENFLKYMLRHYVLVEKSKVEQIYQAKQHILANQNVFGITVTTEAAAQKRLMLCLFPEIGKGDASNVASSEPYVDGFRSNNRLHIATQITASIYSNHKAASRFNSIEALVRKALDIADTLIAECELSTQSLCPAKKGGTEDKYFDSPSLFPNEP